MVKYERTSNGTQCKLNIKCYLYRATLVNRVNYETYNKKNGHKMLHFVILDIRSIKKNRLKYSHGYSSWVETLLLTIVALVI
jgi:hypothetical protein